MTALLVESLPERPFVIPPPLVAEVTRRCGLSSDELLTALVPLAQRFARAPISDYRVGVAGLGASGTVYLGVNLEFPGLSLNQSVHGEQFMVARALALGETGLQTLAVSAAPCGHCRQFLNELEDAAELRILVQGEPTCRLGELLPRFFGPEDLGNRASLLNSTPLDLSLADEPAGDLETAALQAARCAYAPYSGCAAGVALRTGRGLFAGSYIENAAFNPSLSPLQSALAGLVAEGLEHDAIEAACLVECCLSNKPGPSQEESTRTLLAHLAPGAEFSVRRASGAGVPLL